jgi:hypothetical protein
MESTFIACDCHGEVLEVVRFEDDPETYLSFWYYGGMDGKLRWSTRLRLCWKVLRTGRGHPDHLVLTPVQVAELRAALPESREEPSGVHPD